MSAPSIKRIGKYEVIRALGSGGMAQVYVAQDNVGREVAIKLMKENRDMGDELRRRFRREAEATAVLSHKNIVTLYEFDEVDGMPYIVMENLGGSDLAQLLRGRGGKPLPVEQSVDIALQAAAGLAYAHARGVVHRDIKPSNVRVLDDGVVKIMDFGIAHVASSTITKTGVPIGTPQYMSPEQINGSKVDHRTDVWSLGAVLYEMLAGRSPFWDEDRKGHTVERILRLQKKIVMDPTPSFESLGVDVPAELGSIVLRCLEKDPAERYQTIEELSQALENYQKLAVAAIVTLEEEVARDVAKYLSLARALLSSKNFAQAESAAKRVLILDEGNREAKQILEDIETAKRKHAIEQRAQSLAEQARAAASKGDFTSAEKLLARAFEVAPEFRKLEAARAEIAAERERHTVRSLNQHLQQARISIRDNDLSGARAELQAAAEIDPTNTGVRKLERDIERVENRLSALRDAKAAHERGDKKSAREILEGLLDANAGDLEARNLLHELLDDETLAVTRSNPGLTSAYPLSDATAVAETARIDPDGTVAVDYRDAETTALDSTGTILPVRPKARRWRYVVAPLLIVAALLGWWLLPGRDAVAVAIDIAPWAEIEYLRRVDDGRNIDLAASTTTPCVLYLQPGEYEIKFVNPHFPEALTVPLRVQAGQPSSIHMTLPGLELDALDLPF